MLLFINILYIIYILTIVFFYYCIPSFKIDDEIRNKVYDNNSNIDYFLLDKNNNKFKLNKNFLEWLVGFSDAEGNFIITLRDNPSFKIEKMDILSFDDEKLKIKNISKFVNLTFQIGLHIDNLNTLKIIQKEIKCGNISISKNRCNFYVSDFYSIINIIIPIFNYFHLNSTKYSQFIVFRNAAELIRSKLHLTDEGLSRIIHLKNIANIDVYTPKSFNITNYWLLGFVEGDATFSTGSIYRPRLRFECNIKEEKLFLNIQKYFGKGKVVTSSRIRNKIYKSVILDISDIKYFKFVLIPLYKNLNFYTNKYLDFCLWCNIVDLYYLGYHLTLEGKDLIKEIKSIMNRRRLINKNENLYIKDVNIKIINLLNKPSPYVIQNGERYKRINDKIFKFRKYKIIVINKVENKEFIYESLSEAARTLQISRKKIMSILDTGLIYKNYIFNLYK